tara:strand:+ start:185 stop:493 length:309 start_codon:yes stop_codon:yes gene_type:complete
MCGKDAISDKNNKLYCIKRYEEKMCPLTMKSRKKCLENSKLCPFPNACNSKFEVSNSQNQKMARVEGNTLALNCSTKCKSISDCCYLKNPNLYRPEDHIIGK